MGSFCYFCVVGPGYPAKRKTFNLGHSYSSSIDENGAVFSIEFVGKMLLNLMTP
jgi:hypothetical protein